MKTKYANGRWLTVLNSNNLTAKDYQALSNLGKDARKLYEYLCYADYSERGNRFQFSSQLVEDSTGIPSDDVYIYWNQLEKAGIIWRLEGHTNEYAIKINVSNTQLSENKWGSNIIKSEDNSGSPEMAELVKNTKTNTVLETNNAAAGTGSSSKGRKTKMTHIYSHNRHICIMSDLTETARKLATKLMIGDIEYNAVSIGVEFGCDEKSVRNAYDELVKKNHIITIDCNNSSEIHFCCLPYWDCVSGYSKLFPDWNEEKDKKMHCELCDTPA